MSTPRGKFTDQPTAADLMRVELRLDSSINSLVALQLSGGSGRSGPSSSGPSKCRLQLEEAAGLLQKISVSGRFANSKEVDLLHFNLWKSQVVALLHGIETRVQQAQLLNDSAAALCRGWLAVPPLPLDDYTPAGVWECVREPDALPIRA